MTGIPGAGKSFICSLIILNLQTQNGRSPLYYFCGQKSSGGDSCALVLRTLANQLLQQNRDLAPLVQQKYLAKGSSKSSPALKRLLKETLSSVKSTHIILDGIDECNEAVQRDVLLALAEIQRDVGHHCKLLVSSRDEPLIKRSILKKTHVSLDGKTTQSLNLYIQAKITELKSSFPNVGDSLWTDIKRKLQDKADGMFLWVRLVVVNLQQQTSEADLEIAADKLPDGLDEAYGRIILRIRNRHPTERDRAFKVLFWVCTAYRSVTIYEVADGITLKPGQTEINKKTRCQNVDGKIVDICAPFLERSARGKLQMIHFSAKEYLLDAQTGPFVDVPQAHFNAAFSCVVNLTSTLSIVPRYNEKHPDAFFETMLVQGAYGLQQYAHQYWAEHTIAYFENVPQLDGQALLLVDALTAFLRVCKRQEPDPQPQIRSKTTKDFDKLSASLRKLDAFPQIQNLILSWLYFKSKLNEIASNLDGLEALEKWQKLEDSTFLSLIDIQLRQLRENVLRMQRSSLPSHIAAMDYDAFLARYGFGCRVYDCSLNFEHEMARDRHEASHAVFFPCLKCDFSGRGFRTRKQLEQHTRTYHMTHEDFEIPPTLEAASSYAMDPNPRNKRLGPWSPRNHSWNEQGRKVLQSTLRKALSRVESEMTLMDSSTPTQAEAPVATGPSLCSRNESSALSLDIVRSKIDAQQYDTLSEFQDNVHQALNNPATLTLSDSLGDLERICDQEFKNVLMGYPNFVSSEYEDSAPFHARDATQPDDDAAETISHGIMGVMVSKGPYWSVAEEAEFPRLVEQHGRNSSKIADCLMTKSPKDVEEHLTELVKFGRRDLTELADAADARTQQDVDRLKLDLEVEASVLANLTTNRPSDQTLSLDDSLTPHSNETPAPFVIGLDELLNYRPQRNPTNKAAVKPKQQLTQGEAVSTTEKRKPREKRKGFCDYCKEGFHDEYAVFKHIDRFHKSKRKVWICEDVSPDKKFFYNCKHCVKKKRYSAKHNAFKHLRGTHFTLTTPQETLTRWVKEIEVDNPNSDHRHSEALAAKYGDRLPAPSLEVKRRKIDDEPQLLQAPQFSQQAGGLTLPPMRDRPGSDPAQILGNPSSNRLENDPYRWRTSDGVENTDSQTERDTIQDLPDDVSFDNLLSTFPGIPPNMHTPLPFHALSDKALVRPDHIPRLSHLNQFERAACQDQVDALYHVLDEKNPTSHAYKDALEKLEHLSQALIRGIRQWRRNNTFAPSIPFSL